MVAPIKEVKWLILGGDGQLGRAMNLELSRKSLPFISLTREQLDITNQRDINKWFSEVTPDVVLNAAAWTDVDLAETMRSEATLVNAVGPKLVAAACLEIRAKFIHISTDYVFSGSKISPWDEGAKKRPTCVYGETKAEGEESVLGVHPSGSFIVRTSWLYSPWGKNFVKTMLKIALKETRSVEVVSDQVGQPTSAIELASQIHAVLDAGSRPGIYHGTNSGQVSWFGLSQYIFELVGADPSRVIAVDSKRFPRKVARPAYSVLGHARWIEEGLEAMKDWRESLKDSLPAILNSLEQKEFLLEN